MLSDLTLVSSFQTNIQIYPSHKRVVPNDKLSKRAFFLDPAMFTDLIDKNASADITEVKNHPKFGTVKSTLHINFDPERCIIRTPPTQFDFAVLCVCISEWVHGNRYTTPAIIFRGLTGKIGKTDSDNSLSEKQRKFILQSIDKLMGNIITVDITNLCQKLKYNGGKPKTIKSPLLPCKYITSVINGQTVDTIYLTDESPLFTLAVLKNNQIISYDATLLDAPNINNSELNITIKNYVMNRVQEIKSHSLNPSLTFSDIFQKCGINDADLKTKKRARDTVFKFLDHLVSENVIKSYQVIKKFNAFYSVKISY